MSLSLPCPFLPLIPRLLKFLEVSNKSPDFWNRIFLVKIFPQYCLGKHELAISAGKKGFLHRPEARKCRDCNRNKKKDWFLFRKILTTGC